MHIINIKQFFFPQGTTDIEQLALVIRTLGSPKTSDWPELKTLPDYNKIRFPHSNGQKWESLFPSCTNVEEIDLTAKLLTYNPMKRLTAAEVGGSISDCIFNV